MPFVGLVGRRNHRTANKGFFYFQMSLRNTIKQDAFWQINKVLVSKLGIEGAVLLTDLIEKYFHFSDNELTIQREGKEWFYFTSSDIEVAFKIKYKVQKRLLNELVEMNFIETKVLGQPAKLHIHLLEGNVFSFINSFSIAKKAKQEFADRQNKKSQKAKTIYISNNKTNNKKTIIF